VVRTKVSIGILAGGFGEEDKLALYVFAESEQEYEDALRVVSELKRRGIVVKKLMGKEEKCWGWCVILPYGEADKGLELPNEHPLPRYLGGEKND